MTKHTHTLNQGHVHREGEKDAPPLVDEEAEGGGIGHKPLRLFASAALTPRHAADGRGNAVHDAVAETYLLSRFLCPRARTRAEPG